MVREVSLAHLTLVEARPQELIEAAAHGGFDSVSLCLSPSKAGQPFFPVIGIETEIRAIKGALRATGLRILDIECIWLTPERDAASYGPMLETGAELGARFALVIGNDPEQHRLENEFGKLCELANPLRLTMMLEFIPYLSVSSLTTARSILTASGQKNAGLMVDSLHLTRSGGSARDLADIDPQQLCYCQICDAAAARPTDDQLRTEAREGRLYPGEGALPLVDLIRALPATAPLSVEAPSRAHAHKSFGERAKLARQGVRTLGI